MPYPTGIGYNIILVASVIFILFFILSSLGFKLFSSKDEDGVDDLLTNYRLKLQGRFDGGQIQYIYQARKPGGGKCFYNESGDFLTEDDSRIVVLKIEGIIDWKEK